MTHGLGHTQLRILLLIAEHPTGVTASSLRKLLGLDSWNSGHYRVLHSLYLRGVIEAIHPHAPNTPGKRRFYRVSAGTQVTLTDEGRRIVESLPRLSIARGEPSQLDLERDYPPNGDE